MNQIQKLVGEGRLDKAISLLGDDGILLMSRYNRLNQEQRLGTISNSDATLRLNQITHAVLSCAGTSSVNNEPDVVSDNISNTENVLLGIMRDNRRRRPEITEQAKSLLDKVKDWETNKRLDPSFDISGRRRKEIEVLITTFRQQLNEVKVDDLESTVQKITDLLKETIPSYTSLFDAYTLASGRGMKNTWIEEQLQSKPNDKEVRIDITEKIEEWMINISRI